MEKKINIALMTTTIDGRYASGTAIVARKCVEAILARRDEFEPTFIHYEKIDDPIYTHGVREVVLPRFRFALFNRRSLRLLWYFLTTRDRFDIMHWFQPRLYPFFWFAPTKYIVVSVHGTGDIMENKTNFIFSRALYNASIKYFKRYVSAAIGISEFARRDIIEKYGFEKSQVVAITNGADASFVRASDEAIAAVRAKYHLPPGKFFLGVGRLVPIKNVPRMLAAYEQFCKTSKENIPFVHIGSEGIERPRIDAFLAASPVRDRIQLVRYVEQKDLPVVYSAAFALIFPLLNEGFGLPAIEAMSCGTPTVISNTAAPEISEDDAILVDAQSTESIAEGIRRIAEDAALRAHLIERGSVLARTFTWEEMGRKLIALYKALMSHGSLQSADTGR